MFKPGMLSFCAHCFSQVTDAIQHFNETSHSKFLHDGEPIDLNSVDLKSKIDEVKAKIEADRKTAEENETKGEADKPL